jgi:23S rRNA pseudouridine2605 synthase
LIADGKITINGEIITTLGYKVQPDDKVFFGKKKLNPEKLIYLLLNKPKDFITTTDDPQNRKTVMDLVKTASEERIFPVGRLDRQTTGLLLFTNDGDLAKKLSHPSHNVKKIYHVILDKPLSKKGFEAIQDGVELDDGKVNVDELVILSKDKKEIGLEIHLGRNRIVRRLFEHLDFKIRKLDRVIYAGLTKKDLPRGKWRLLSDKEVIRLKHF